MSSQKNFNHEPNLWSKISPFFERGSIHEDHIRQDKASRAAAMQLYNSLSDHKKEICANTITFLLDHHKNDYNIGLHDILYVLTYDHLDQVVQADFNKDQVSIKSPLAINQQRSLSKIFETYPDLASSLANMHSIENVENVEDPIDYSRHEAKEKLVYQAHMIVRAETAADLVEQQYHQAQPNQSLYAFNPDFYSTADLALDNLGTPDSEYLIYRMDILKQRVDQIIRSEMSPLAAMIEPIYEQLEDVFISNTSLFGQDTDDDEELEEALAEEFSQMLDLYDKVDYFPDSLSINVLYTYLDCVDPVNITPQQICFTMFQDIIPPVFYSNTELPEDDEQTYHFMNAADKRLLVHLNSKYNFIDFYHQVADIQYDYTHKEDFDPADYDATAMDALRLELLAAINHDKEMTPEIYEELRTQAAEAALAGEEPQDSRYNFMMVPTKEIIGTWLDTMNRLGSSNNQKLNSRLTDLQEQLLDMLMTAKSSHGDPEAVKAYQDMYRSLSF